MTDSLDSKTDGELNELFAVEVAGWMRSEERACDWWIPGAGLAQGEPLVFCTDANAVLPFLPREPSGNFWVCHAGYMGHRVCIHGGTCADILAEAHDKTFHRAAVIALLRAKRARK